MEDSSMDSDMMNTEVAPATPSSFPSEQTSGVRGLLTLARQLIDQDKPSQALQAVVMAMRTKGGDEAVVHIVHRAQELYRNKLQASSAADELASLFAECAIAEALPTKSEPSQANMVAQSFEPDAQGTSILAETGRKHVMLDAFSNGSSFVCLQCGGLVSNNRKDEHYAFWCCNR